MTKTELRLLWWEVVQIRNKLLKYEAGGAPSELDDEYFKKYQNFLKVSNFSGVGEQGVYFDAPNGSRWFDLHFPKTGEVYKWDEPL